MIKFIVSIIFIAQSSFAGFPPTSAKGQSEANPTTTFFFQAPNNQFSTTSGSTRLLETGNENLLANPSFETGDLTGWTNGSFTFTKVTSIVAAGLASAGFAVTSAATIVTQTITPTIKIAGRNLIASAWIETSTGVPVSVCFMEAGVEQACTSATNANQGWYPVSASFPGISDGDTIGIRVKSTTGTAANVYVDDAYLGVAALGTSSISTGPALYTPTISGFGTNTLVNFLYWRQNSDLHILGTFTTGTPAASTASITLPSGLAASSLITSTLNVGTFTANHSGAVPAIAIINGGGTTLNFSVYGDAGGTFSADNGNSLATTTDPISIDVVVPIQGWNTLSAISPSQAANLWSGYHDNTCSWARTSTSYGDPTADASCALVQRQNSNFGTVTTYNSAGSALPGIVITPSSSGVYWICATPKIAGATLAATLDVRLWDGITTVAEGESQQQVATDIEQLTICGLDNLTAGTSTTLSLQTKATSGAATIATNSTNASAVEWSIANMTFSTPSPLLVGSVMNPGQAVEVIARANILCSSSSSITSQSGTWISAIGNISSGACALTLTGFSAAPACTVTRTDSVGATLLASIDAVPTSTSVSVHGFNTGGTGATSYTASIICMGPK